MSLFRFGLFICSLFVLSGCATPPTNSGSVIYKKPETIDEIDNYTASGKILLVSKKEKQSGYFYWRQSKAGYQFVVSTILGIDVFSLKVDASGATVYVDGKEHSGTDPQTLLRSLTGQTLPLQHISEWLIGKVDSERVLNIQMTPKGRPDRFLFQPEPSPFVSSNGQSWSVHYQKYSDVDGLQLPSQIQISSTLNRIKLKINDWEL